MTQENSLNVTFGGTDPSFAQTERVSTHNSAPISADGQGTQTGTSASDNEGENSLDGARKVAQYGGDRNEMDWTGNEMALAWITSYKNTVPTHKVAYWDARSGPIDQPKLAVFDFTDGVVADGEVSDGEATDGERTIVQDRKILVTGSKLQDLLDTCESYGEIAGKAKHPESQAFWTALRNEIAVASFSYNSNRNLGTSHEENGFKTGNDILNLTGVHALHDEY